MSRRNGKTQGGDEDAPKKGKGKRAEQEGADADQAQQVSPAEEAKRRAYQLAVLQTFFDLRAFGGVLSTEGGLAFAGYRDFFRAFDADTGTELWKINLGARVRGSPIAYEIEGRQYVAVAAGHTMFTFALNGP